MSENDDKKFQEEWKLEKEMIKNRQVCETCKHWQVGNSEFCLKKFICHLPHHTCLNWEECTCLNWEEGIKAEYYPYPPNSTWEEKEEINKKHIEEWKDYLETIEKEIEEEIKEEDIQIVIHISKNPSEEEVRRVEFYKNFIISQGHKNVIVEEVDDVTEFVAQLM